MVTATLHYFTTRYAVGAMPLRRYYRLLPPGRPGCSCMLAE
jgi:hypothetical protein